MKDFFGYGTIKFSQMLESYLYIKNTGTDIAVVSIYNEPDVSFHATDFDVGFIISKNIVGFVVIMIYYALYKKIK